MVAVHVFLCHNVDQTEQKDKQILDQLCTRLRKEGAEIVSYPGSPDEEDFLTFFQQQLPTCQWFILFQTPTVASLPKVRLVVNAVLKLVEQKRMEGIVRFIARPDASREVPSEWSSIPTFDATYDFSRAVEKLLLRLSGERQEDETAMTASPLSLSLNNALSSSDYDRPPPPPSRLRKFSRTIRNGYQDLIYEHKRFVIVFSILVIITLLGSSLAFFLFSSTSSPRPKPVVQIPVYGSIHFSSTDLAITEATTHILDEVDVHLQNVKLPMSGDSYYVWLLPDEANSTGPTFLLGSFLPVDGSADFSYKSPTQNDLLATESRLLITEESTRPQPDNPTADETRWHYYGEFPQITNPTDVNHFSALDHLRHLLVNGPIAMMSPGNGTLPGGLGIWMLQNVHMVFEWSAEARGGNTLPDAHTMRNNLIQILDTLDGGSLVHLDVPQGTPLLVNATIAGKPLLTLDPNMMIPGYVHDIEAHLLEFSGSPGVTNAQQTRAGEIDSELNAIGMALEQAREDARQLVALSDQQLLDPSSIPLLDDLANQSMIAYTGQFDSTTGLRSGGTISIFDHLQQLAQFPVIAYSTQQY